MKKINTFMNYVTDTHSLVWYLTEDDRLSKQALRAFEATVQAGTIYIPALVLAEIQFISKKGKIVLSFEETLERVLNLKNFKFVPLELSILRIANQIKPNLEMHDKLIVATAIQLEATLITKDEDITLSNAVSVVW
ncbi:MAG: type II toxin-antitoxin system VapC family toxin [Deltaproteobacteria bacterium]|nr:type II toxin-antitoxin system VapC family toxin [Deltaproteobacteria bacterium]